MRLILLGLVAAFSLASYATEFQDVANQELAQIKQVFSFAYAPREWKKQQYNWNLDSEFAAAQSAVTQKADLSLNDYRKIATNFLRTTRDYHVSVYFYSTEKATLPFSIVGSQGRYFIMYIDRTKLSETQFPFNVGDEVLEFGGQKIADVVSAIKAETATSVDVTDEAWAQILVTRRSARSGGFVPQGPIEIKVNHKNPETEEYKEITAQLTWEYTPEDITWKPTSTDMPIKTTANKWRKEMIFPQWKFLKADDGDGTPAPAPTPAPNPFMLGERVSWVPALGPKIWESDATAKFYAYIYRSPEGKIIGYVRIPHYSASTAEFTEFKALIKKFQASTDALVIDEVNNPGGSIFYVYALQSLLEPNTSFAPPHQIALTPAMIADANDNLRKLATVKNDKDAQKVISEGQADIDGYPINYEFAQFSVNFYRTLLAEWNANHMLTKPMYLWGVDRINQDRDGAYTKPIMVLVNQLCFSGGDFFPSMLQDNKRATIFGTRTSGAGGWIEEVQVPSRLGMEEFSVTGSIAWRIGNKPIENLGVTPDVQYDVTPDDLSGGFEGYKKAVNAAVADLLK